MKIITLYITISIFSIIAYNQGRNIGTVESYQQTTINTEKKIAFDILNTKCNVCHLTRNRRKVFTLENMDQFAEQINEQVFIKQRMPKGREIKLSDSDFSNLKKWLTSLNIH